MTETWIGRQPIFDRQLATYAYELLFRSPHVASPTDVPHPSGWALDVMAAEEDGLAVVQDGGLASHDPAARQAQIYSSRTFNFTSYLAAAALFLAATIPLTRLTDHLLRRQRRRTGTGARA